MLSSEAILAILAFGDMEDALRRKVLKKNQDDRCYTVYCTKSFHISQFFKK
jgi:hypothetical protein